MIQGFYSAAVGAQQQMYSMDVHGNNISNINTQGFKAQVPSFQSLMYSMQGGIDGSQLPKGSGSLMALTGTDFSAGPMEETGRSLDFAIAGEGYFALYEPATGQVSFTRDGSFTLSSFQEPVEDQEGQTAQAGQTQTVYYLSDGEGRQVLGTDGYPIAVTDPNARSFRRRLYHPISGRTGAGRQQPLPHGRKKRRGPKQ